MAKTADKEDPQVQESHEDAICRLRGKARWYAFSMPALSEELNELADALEAAHARRVEAVARTCCSLGRLAGYGARQIDEERKKSARAGRPRRRA